MRFFTTVFLLSVVPGVVCKRIGSSDAKPTPFPFEPPSEEFCKTNILGDDAYFSMFKPCDITFYTASEALRPAHFSCDAYDSSMVIKTESRKVLMWPESCVAVGPRCYYLADFPDLPKFVIYEDQENYAMEFPFDATVVSMDCSADYEQAQVFMENLPEQLGDVAKSIAFFAFVILFAVTSAIVACICCCFGACNRRGRTNGVTYTVVPTSATKVLV